MQVSARQDILFSSALDRCLFRLSCGYAPLRSIMSIYALTISRPIDGLMSLSFWDRSWCMYHDGMTGYIPACGLLADFQETC